MLADCQTKELIIGGIFLYISQVGCEVFSTLTFIVCSSPVLGVLIVFSLDLYALEGFPVVTQVNRRLHDNQELCSIYLKVMKITSKFFT